MTIKIKKPSHMTELHIPAYLRRGAQYHSRASIELYVACCLRAAFAVQEHRDTHA